jgi:hypothetical protein
MDMVIKKMMKKIKKIKGELKLIILLKKRRDKK